MSLANKGAMLQGSGSSSCGVRLHCLGSPYTEEHQQIGDVATKVRTLRLQRLSKDKQCQLDASGTPMTNSARKASPIQGGNDLQMCQLSCGHPTSLCCTSSYDFTKRTFSKYHCAICQNPCLSAIIFPRCHQNVELAAPESGQLHNSRLLPARGAGFPAPIMEMTVFTRTARTILFIICIITPYTLH